MGSLQHVAFLADTFTLGSPAHLLLDRFLIGFPREGTFVRSHLRVAAWSNQPAEAGLLEQRESSFGLGRPSTAAEALHGADAVVVVNWPRAAAASRSLVRLALEQAPAVTPLFVYGLLAPNVDEATELLQFARVRGCELLAGTAVPHAFRLPDIDVPAGTRLREGLIVVQGAFPDAELAAVEGLLPLLERRPGGEAGVRRIHSLPAGQLWHVVNEKHWTWPLLAAAISRSQTPQGNPVLDGRTEDLVGLGLLPKLAPQARGWLLEHVDGLRTALLVLDGAVTDFNFAIRTHSHEILSAQLFRPPPPRQEHYSRLAGAVTDFFTSGHPPWTIDRALTECRAMAEMTKAI